MRIALLLFLVLHFSGFFCLVTQGEYLVSLKLELEASVFARLELDMLLHRMSCSLDEELENVDFPKLFHGGSPPPSPLSTSLILVFPEIA